MKKCFIISPIGSEGSAERNKADKVLNHIIKPVTESFDYDTIRADEVSDPGLISKSILQHLIQSELVIADLSGHNPNVFYELAVRHAFGKPVIQIIDKSDKIPFDVNDMRTIFYSLDLDDVLEAKDKLAAAIESLPVDGLIETPISEVASLLSISEMTSSDSAISELVLELQRIPEYLNSMENRLAGRMVEIMTKTHQTGSIEEKLGMVLFEKLLEDPSKANQMVSAMNQIQHLGNKISPPNPRKKR